MTEALVVLPRSQGAVEIGKYHSCYESFPPAGRTKGNDLESNSSGYAEVTMKDPRID